MNCPTCGVSIETHPANACLNALVAERVMELKGIEKTKSNPIVGKWEGSWMYMDKGWRRRLPKFSENIADAFQVVEKMKLSINKHRRGKTPLPFSLHYDPCSIIGGRKPMWCVETEADEMGPCEWVIGDTPQLAICRAALLALEE